MEYESIIKMFDHSIACHQSDVNKKQTELAEAKKDLYSKIEDKRKYIDVHKKIACKECYGCYNCDHKDELNPNWECSKGYELGTKCEHFYELPF